MTIDLLHLRYFTAAAQHGSFRKAAESLRVRESAISRRIRDLEGRVGTSLFIRHSGGVELTLSGQRFLLRARSALKHIDYARLDVSAILDCEDGLIRIGVCSAFSSGFLSELIHAFGIRYPGVQLDFVDGSPSDHIVSALQVKLDVAFVPELKERLGCESQQFWSERLYVVLPSHHSLARKDELTWDELALEAFMMGTTPADLERVMN